MRMLMARPVQAEFNVPPPLAASLAGAGHLHPLCGCQQRVTGG
jgi:hypothetical protein